MNRGNVHSVEAYAHLLEQSELETVAAGAAGGLFVWWPELFATLNGASQMQVLAKFVSDDRPPCRRNEMTAAQRERIYQQLPGVWARAGTFPTDSGPNCFGAVTEAHTGKFIVGRTERDTFAAWLNQHRPHPGDATEMGTEMGTVLLWHDEKNTLQHAAISLGDGYAFHKEAQTWWSPWQVVRLSEVVERWQNVGVMSAVNLTL